MTYAASRECGRSMHCLEQPAKDEGDDMAIDVIQNGDFNNDKLGWQFTSGGSSIVGSEEVIIGNKYCKVASTESIYQPVPLPVGATFTARFRYRGVPGGTVAIMKLNTNTIYWSKEITPIGAGEWHDASYELEIDSEWVGPFMLHFQAHSSPGNFLELDDIALESDDVD